MVVWIVGTSESFQACIQQSQKPESYDTLYEGFAVLSVPWGRIVPCTGIFIRENSDAIIAVFTIILGLSTIGLWLQTDRLAKGAENTAVRQLRAYVAIKPAQLTEIRVGQVPSASFTMENTGQTPAYHVRYLAFVSVMPYPLNDDQGDLVGAYEGQKMPDLTLHSRGQTEGEAIDDSALTGDAFNKAMTGNGFRLYMAGMVRYDDAFGIGRKTKFCAFVEADELRRVLSIPPTPERPAETRITWIFSHVHNEST